MSETGSSESAAAAAHKFNLPADDSTSHSSTARLGQRAEAQLQLELSESGAPNPTSALKVVAPADPLIIQLDGFQVHYRGPQWGAARTERRAGRVDWHEMTVGVVYRHDHAGCRGLLS